MARKEKKYHFIYKTTNLLSGKYYIGMHSTDDLEDGYLGSGNRLRLAIRKHGKENFKREILEFCETRNELKKRESEIVNLDEVAKKECMNLKVGGEGGWPESAKAKFMWLLNNNPEFKKQHSLKRSESNKKAIKEGKLKVPTCDWSGKKHSLKSRKLISESKRGTGMGETNSQHNTCWVTRGGENKKIKNNELQIYINDGWVKGRKSNISGEKVKTSKLKKSDIIEIKKLLFNSDLTQKNVANMFGVKRETISKIKRGIIWVNVI